MQQRRIRRHRTFTAIAVALLMGTTTVLALAGPAGASEGCGGQSFGFAGTRLLNDGISDSAGPFAISLAAGTYDITMRSHDAHDEHPGQFEQTAEQWYFTLDSGYVSGPTIDVPDDANTSTTILTGQAISAATSITVHHRGVGNINSVDVVCVGFSPAQQVQEPEPISDITEPAAIVRTPVPEDTDEDIEPEVAGVVETPPAVGASSQTPVATTPQLALTGPNDRLYTLAIGGLALIAFGRLLVLGQRRWAQIER